MGIRRKLRYAWIPPLHDIGVWRCAIVVALLVSVAFGSTAEKAATSLPKQIRHAFRRAQEADTLLGNETMFSSSLPPNQQRQIVAAGRRNYAIALAGYRRVLSLLRAARREGIALPPRLAEKVLSQAAWGLRPLVLGKESLQITIRDERAATKLFPDDPLPYQFLARIYHAEAILIPFGKRGVVDRSTGRITKWVKLHPTSAQRKLRLRYLRQSGRFAEIAIRLTHKDPMANYLLWEDLGALGLDAKGRDFYLAVAVTAREHVRPIDFHYNSFRIKNFENTLENYGRWERNPTYRRMQEGRWPQRWPQLPVIPSSGPGK